MATNEETNAAGTDTTVHDGQIVTEPVQRKAPGNNGNTEMEKTGPLKSALKSSSSDATNLASKIQNIGGKLTDDSFYNTFHRSTTLTKAAEAHKHGRNDGK
ncbi:hypothetical protein Tco_0556543 [Tanacetum coccineum]